jgi:hypothetical protein
MRIKKLLMKYAILLLAYILVVRFVQPYGIRLWFTMSENPDMTQMTMMTLEGIIALATFAINLAFVILLLIDSKQKIVLDWLIMVITFFSAETGVLLFLFWQVFKESAIGKEQLGLK